MIVCTFANPDKSKFLLTWIYIWNTFKIKIKTIFNFEFAAQINVSL